MCVCVYERGGRWWPRRVRELARRVMRSARHEHGAAQAWCIPGLTHALDSMQAGKRAGRREARDTERKMGDGVCLTHALSLSLTLTAPARRGVPAKRGVEAAPASAGARRNIRDWVGVGGRERHAVAKGK